MRNTLRVITLVVIAALAATALPFVSTASARTTTDEGAGTSEGDPAYCVRVANAAGFPVPGAEVVAKAFFPAFRAASDARSAVTNASGEARIELPPSSTYLVTIEDPYGWYADTNVDDHGRRLYAHALAGNCDTPVQVTLEERWPVGYLTAVLADATFATAPGDVDAPDAVAEVLAPVDAGALTVKRTSLASLRTAFESVANGADFEQDVRYRFRAEPGSESNITLACPDANTIPGAPRTFSVRVGGSGYTPLYIPIEADTCTARTLSEHPDLSLYRTFVPVNGRLVVESTGAPATGATVTATLTKGAVATGADSPYVLTAVTDAHGEFTLRVPWLEDGEAVFTIVAERNGLESPVFELAPGIEDVDGTEVSLKIPSVRVTAAPRVRAYVPAEDGVTYADGVRTCLKPTSSEAEPDCWVADVNGARPTDAGGACIEVPPEPHEVTIVDPEGRFEPRRFSFTFTEPAVPITCDGSTLPDTTLTSTDWMLLDVGTGLVTGRAVDAVAADRSAIDPSVPFVQIARDGEAPACTSGLDGRFECLLPLPEDEVVGAQSVGDQEIEGISRGHQDSADVEISSGAEFPDHYASQTIAGALRLGVVRDVGDVELARTPVTVVLNLTGRFSDNVSTPLPPDNAAPAVRHERLPDAGVACEVTVTEAPSTAFYECKSPELVWDGAPTFRIGETEEVRAWAPEPFNVTYAQPKRGAYYPESSCLWTGGILPGNTDVACTAVAEAHERVVTGIVRDAHDGTPLEGVEVKVMESADGAVIKPDASKDKDCQAERYVCITTSAADGSFELRVPGLEEEPETGYCVEATGPTGYQGSGLVCLDGGAVELFRTPITIYVKIMDAHARVVVPEVFVNATLPAEAHCGNASAPNYVCSQTTPRGFLASPAGLAGVAALNLPWGFPFSVTVAESADDLDAPIESDVHYFAYRTRPVNDGETTLDTEQVWEPAFENVGPLDKELLRYGRLTNPTQPVSVRDFTEWEPKTVEFAALNAFGEVPQPEIHLTRARETITVKVDSSGGTSEETPATVQALPRYYPAWATPRTFCDPGLDADATSVCESGATGVMGDVFELEVPIVRAETPSVDAALEANAGEPNGSWHLLATADGHYSGAIVGVDADDPEEFAFSLVPRSLEKPVNFTLRDTDKRELEPADAPNLVVCVFPLDSRLDGLDADPVATLERPVDDLASGTDLERLGARCRSGHEADFLVKWTRIVRQNDVQERQFGFVVDGTPEYAPTTGSFNVTAADDGVQVNVELVPVLAAATGDGAGSATLRAEVPCDGSVVLSSAHDAWITRILTLAGPVPRDAVTPCTGGAAE